MYLRVNPKKATRESVLAMLVDRNIPATPDGLSPTAIRIDASPRGLRNLELFLAGHFEFQDGGSQAVIDELGDLTGKSVLDYCAGGGGKSLALAALGSKVTACDLYPARMKELPERAKRAGVSIGTSNIDDVAKNAPYDVVLCDVPCSGSGAWRRQPDAKWNLTQERLDELGATQLDVLSRVASMVAPKGILAYVTCSLLKCENEDVVGSFVQANKDWSVLRHRQISPIGPCTLEGGKNGKILGWHDLS